MLGVAFAMPTAQNVSDTVAGSRSLGSCVFKVYQTYSFSCRGPYKARIRMYNENLQKFGLC